MEEPPFTDTSAVSQSLTAASGCQCCWYRPCSDVCQWTSLWPRPPLQLTAGREPQLLPCTEVGEPLPLPPRERHSAPSPHSASAHTCAPVLCLEDLHCFYIKLITIDASSKSLKCLLSNYQLGTTGDHAIQCNTDPP